MRPQDRFYYMTQIMGYCRMIGCLNGRLLVGYANGNYSPTLPNATCVDFEFTQLELDENWLMVVNHLDYMKDNGETPWVR